MCFVAGYKHDVFVSYAHIDDELLPGEEVGWVSTLIDCLRVKLHQELGSRETNIWMDPNLTGNSPITGDILDALSNSATLLVVLSPSYINSEWCAREKNRFLEGVNKLYRSGSRVFVVERTRVEREKWPSEFGDLRGYRFWKEGREGKSPKILGSPTSTEKDQTYFDQLSELTNEIAQELDKLAKAKGEAGQVSITADFKKYILLAEVTDDLDPLRNEVKRYLNQAGIGVLPDRWYPRDPANFQKALDLDLKRCDLFVQLFSCVAGKKFPDLPTGYHGLQYERAKLAGKNILQWHSPEIEIESITDPDYRALLELETVLVVGIEEFKREVKKQCLYEPPPARLEKIKAFVFVDIDETSDAHLLDSICDTLDHVGAGYMLPSRKGTPGDVRRDLEQKILDCNALIVVYGRTHPDWVEEQLMLCRKTLLSRQPVLRAIAVYEGPPEEKERLRIRLPNMRVINCRHGCCESELKSFLDTVQMELSS